MVTPEDLSEDKSGKITWKWRKFRQEEVTENKILQSCMSTELSPVDLL